MNNCPYKVGDVFKNGWRISGIISGYYVYPENWGEMLESDEKIEEFPIFIPSDKEIEIYQFRFAKKFPNNPEGYRKLFAYNEVKSEFIEEDYVRKMMIKQLDSAEKYKLEEMKKELGLNE